MKVKKGDRVKFKGGEEGTVHSSYPWIDGRWLVTLAGRSASAARLWLEDLVQVNGKPVGGAVPERKPGEADLKAWAAQKHRVEVHAVLAGAYKGRGKGGGLVGVSGGQPRTHAFVDGAQKSPCGIDIDRCSDLNEPGPPDCSRCASKIRGMNR